MCLFLSLHHHPPNTGLPPYVETMLVIVFPISNLESMLSLISHQSLCSLFWDCRILRNLSEGLSQSLIIQEMILQILN